LRHTTGSLTPESDPRRSDDPRALSECPCWIALAVLLTLFATLLFARLSRPLLWQDEGETAIFAERILDHGYPRVHGARGVAYGMDLPLEEGTRKEDGAYVGSLWGQYYAAVPGAWWARQTDDPYARTLRLRLPFALAGTLGLGLLYLALAPTLARSTAGRLLGAAAFTAGCILSVSLILHLREVRYYALVILLIGGLVLVERRRPTKRSGRLLRACGLAASLILLGLTFHPAAAGAALWVAVEAWLRRRPRSVRSERRADVWTAAALGVAAALAIPVVLEFHVLEVARAVARSRGMSPELYVDNLRLILQFLVRYELLLPAVVLRLLVLASRWWAPEEILRSGAASAAAAASLWRLVLLQVLVGAANPFFFERYFVVLSPLLVLAAVADGAAWLALLRGLPRRGALQASSGLLALLVLVPTLCLRFPELAGRVREIRTPYVGPMDVVVDVLFTHAPDPAALTVATNYEREVLMYYLGCRVQAGLEGEDVPDLVVLRRFQTGSRHLRAELQQDPRFVPLELPVADLPFNNVPELFTGRHLRTTHLWEAPPSSGVFGALTMFVR